MLSTIFGRIKGALNKNLVIVLFLLIAALSVYLWGQRMGYRGIYPLQDENLRAFIAMGLVLAAALFSLFLILRWIWRAIRNRRSRVSREPTAEEIEAKKMDTMFAKVIKTMRQKWEGKGNPVDHLPWYLVLGAQNSGKSSFIETSDLKFPIDHEIRQATKPLGDGEAVNFLNWRVSGKEAVLLDINGKHFTSEQERSDMQRMLWNSFLRNLRKNRKKRSINGAILVVDVLDFAHSGENQRLDFADRARRQLMDVIEKLGTRLPVYVVFTKLDLISGFHEFNSAIPKEEQDKLFGFHFLMRPDGEQDWRLQLEDQVAHYLDQFSEVMSSYLHRIPSTNGRREAYAFYRSMHGLIGPLRHLMGDIFDEDKFSTAPMVRGVYFTSSRQENAPENLFLDVVSHRYALPAPVFASTKLRSKPIFSANLLHGQIFPEAALAGYNRKRFRSNLRRNALALIFSLGLSAVTIGYWFSSYAVNLNHANAMVVDIDEFQYSGLQIDTTTPPETYLPSLNLARNAALQFEGWREKNSLVAFLTLYQGKRLGPYGDYVYLNALNTEYVPALTDIVGERLRGVCPQGSEEELRLLRVYRMLGEPERRRNEVITEFFQNDWANQYQGDNLMQSELNGGLDYALTHSRISYPTDQQIIQASLSHLENIPPSQRVYSALRTRADASLVKDIDLRVEGGANFAYVYENESIGIQSNESFGMRSNLNSNFGCAQSITDSTSAPFVVDEIYTRHAFLDFFGPNIDNAAELASNDLWVFNENVGVEYSDADIERVKEQVWNIYSGQYVTAWDEAINQLEMRPIDNLHSAVVVTEALGSTDSPIRRIVESLSRETVIYEEKPDDEELDVTKGDIEIEGLGAQMERVAAADIRRSFVEYQQMAVPPNDNGSTQIDAITEASQSLSRYLADITEQPNPSARALEIAINRANGIAADDPFDNLRRVATGVPEPFRSQLINVADNSWRLILEEASVALNQRWGYDIYDDYANYIAGRYPINRGSGEDVPVQDFAAFFRPGGKLDQFYTQELSPFFDLRSGQPRVIDGQSLKLDPAAIEALVRAHDITTSFFDPSGQLSIQFSVTPVSMTRGLMRSVINIEGQTVEYAHGPTQTANIIWPNVVGGSGSRVDMSPRANRGGSNSITASGAWSWLRLIDKGGKSGGSNNSIDVSFYISGSQGVTYRFRSESEFNPIVNSSAGGFRLPQTLSIEPERIESVEEIITTTME